MNQSLDALNCNICRQCYRSDTSGCREACRMCGIATFSDDTINVYPGSGPLPIGPFWPSREIPNKTYINQSRFAMFYEPSMLPIANHFGSYFPPSMYFWN